jgi:hypothetical protein
MSQANPNKTQIDRGARAFILNGGNQSEAWREAYPDSKAKADSMHQAASRFFKLPQVQSRISKIQEELAVKDKIEFDITAEESKKLLIRAYNAGMRNKVDKFGNKIAVAPAAAVSAVSEINKMNGYHAAKKLDHTSTDGTMSPGAQEIDLSKLSTETLRELAEAIENGGDVVSTDATAEN